MDTQNLYFNMSTQDLAVSFKAEVDELRRLLFVTTEVLSVAILLLFILVLVLVWRVNSVSKRKWRRRKEVTNLSGQTYCNPAFLSDLQQAPATNTLSSMQHVYNGDKPPEYNTCS